MRLQETNFCKKLKQGTTTQDSQLKKVKRILGKRGASLQIKSS